MEHWAGRRTCLRLGVIPSPGPQPVLASAGGELWAPTAPPAPLSSWSSHHILRQPSGAAFAPAGSPSAVSASQRRARLCTENQPQMWHSSCCWRAMSGDGRARGHGDSTRDLLESGAPEGVYVTCRVTVSSLQGGLPRKGDRDTQGLPSPWGEAVEQPPALECGKCHPQAVFWEAGSLADRSQVPVAVPPPSAGAELSPGVAQLSHGDITNFNSPRLPGDLSGPRSLTECGAAGPVWGSGMGTTR